MISFFVPGFPKSANARGQWAKYAVNRNRQEFRKLTAALCGELEWPGEQPGFVRVIAQRQAPQKRKRDPLSLAEMLKPILDGIVDAGLLPDDSEDDIEIVLVPTTVFKGATPGIHITLEDPAT